MPVAPVHRTLTTLLAGCLLAGMAAPAWADDDAIRYRLQGDRLVMAPQKPAGKAPVKPAPSQKPAAVVKDPVATKARVAIVDFRAIGAAPAVAEAVTENLANAVVGLQCFTVLERSQIQQMIKEQAFGQSGMVDAQAAVSLGKLLGANIIVVGSVTRLGDTTTVNARFIDVQTAVAIDARNLATTDERDLAGVVSQLAFELSNSMGCNQGQPGSTDTRSVISIYRSKALATTLSVIVPGTGQFYGGNPSSGWLFLGLEAAGIAGMATSLTALQCNPLGMALFVPAALLTLMNTIWSAAHAHATTPEELRVVH